jgi:hypothetical protein
VVRARATENDWRAYYDRADAQRAVIGDPFMRHIKRETFRERVLLAGSSLFVAALVSAFYLLTTR